MSTDIEEYRGASITIRFDGSKCIHSRFCVLGQPGVFRANVEGPWIDPGAADPERIAEVAHRCPSGAITYERHDGRPQETPPAVNTARVLEHGPVALHGDLVLDGEPAGTRMTLCRCGSSKNKPFCDGSHSAAKFEATGEPPTAESKPLESRGGPLEITPFPNGPVGVKGNLEVVAGTGRTVQRTTNAALCRCGASANKPFCDGSHSKIGFTTE